MKEIQDKLLKDTRYYNSDISYYWTMDEDKKHYITIIDNNDMTNTMNKMVDNIEHKIYQYSLYG